MTNPFVTMALNAGILIKASGSFLIFTNAFEPEMWPHFHEFINWFFGLDGYRDLHVDSTSTVEGSLFRWYKKTPPVIEITEVGKSEW